MTNDLDPRTAKNYRQRHKLLDRQVFYKGDVIVEQDADSSRAFYIEDGKVEVEIKDQKHKLAVSTLGPGEIFGEMGLIDHTARSATVKALEDCTVTIISRDELETRLMSIEDKAVRALIHLLIKRLKEANRGQVTHYKNLAEFQSRIACVFEKAEDGIKPDEKDHFREEVEPLLEKLELILDKYSDRNK